MTPFAAAQITRERLKLWQKRNEREGHASTPAVLINLNHNEPETLIINTVEDLTDAQVLTLLKRAVEILESQIRKGN